MLSLENRKLEWLIKQGEDKDEDLNFVISLVPYMKQHKSEFDVCLSVHRCISAEKNTS